MNWDQYFMGLAHQVSMRSKDRSTKVGCVIVGPDNEIRATGYNGFPRGIDDEAPERGYPASEVEAHQNDPKWGGDFQRVYRLLDESGVGLRFVEAT